jgi:hypothetical protein
MVAAEKDFEEAIYLLVLKHSARLDSIYFYNTPLTMAIHSGSIRAVRALIELKADVNQVISTNWRGILLDGCTALHVTAIATEEEELDTEVMPFIVQYLLAGGADINIKNAYNRLAGDMTTNLDFQYEIDIFEIKRERELMFMRRKNLYIILRNPQYDWLVELHREISKFL